MLAAVGQAWQRGALQRTNKQVLSKQASFLKGLSFWKTLVEDQLKTVKVNKPNTAVIKSNL